MNTETTTTVTVADIAAAASVAVAADIAAAVTVASIDAIDAARDAAIDAAIAAIAAIDADINAEIAAAIDAIDADIAAALAAVEAAAAAAAATIVDDEAIAEALGLNVDAAAVNVKYAGIVFANSKNAYIKKAYRRNKDYRTAVLVKDVLDWVMNRSCIYPSYAIDSINWKKVKSVAKEDGVSYKKVKNLLTIYFHEIEEYSLNYGCWHMPSTKDVIKKLKN